MNSNNVHSGTTTDNRIVGEIDLITPEDLKNKYKLGRDTEEFILKNRQTTSDIIHLRDDKLLVVAGPCSIHDVDSALEYAKELKKLKDRFQKLHIVMRTYLEKPRTSIGWKGFINDPHLDGTYNIEYGLEKARKLLLEINEMRVPVSTEFLDTISPQDIGDLITCGAIGARTTESQLHRELTSGLSSIVGYKNGTMGNTDIAINAIKSSLSPHFFLGVGVDGKRKMIKTAGNSDTHLILRGGSNGPNYDVQSVNQAIQDLEESGINTGIMIDFSHANSEKNHHNQLDKVCPVVADQIRNGNNKIVGVMLESNLVEGNQKYTPGESDPSKLIYGQSITDACIDLTSTYHILQDLDSAVSQRRNK